MGPILLSALSLFASFHLIQMIGAFLFPSFELLASRGLEKIAFSTMVLLQIFMFGTTQSFLFFSKFLHICVTFCIRSRWHYKTALFFSIFFIVHSLLFALFYFTGYVTYIPDWGIFTPSLVLRILFGFFVTFLLAWSEELIFRGMIYMHFVRYMRPITSILATSLIFMFSHDITNPINLITTSWELGLGLFLLGFFLNIIFCYTEKLYIGMGIHMGLVAVKVVMRRIPFLIFAPEVQWAWWVHKDLRQSHLIHILFIIVIIGLMMHCRKKLVTRPEAF